MHIGMDQLMDHLTWSHWHTKPSCHWVGLGLNSSLKPGLSNILINIGLSFCAHNNLAHMYRQPNMHVVSMNLDICMVQLLNSDITWIPLVMIKLLMWYVNFYIRNQEQESHFSNLMRWTFLRASIQFTKLRPWSCCIKHGLNLSMGRDEHGSKVYLGPSPWPPQVQPSLPYVHPVSLV